MSLGQYVCVLCVLYVRMQFLYVIMFVVFGNVFVFYMVCGVHIVRCFCPCLSSNWEFIFAYHIGMSLSLVPVYVVYLASEACVVSDTCYVYNQDCVALYVPYVDYFMCETCTPVCCNVLCIYMSVLQEDSLQFFHVCRILCLHHTVMCSNSVFGCYVSDNLKRADNLFLACLLAFDYLGLFLDILYPGTCIGCDLFC